MSKETGRPAFPVPATEWHGSDSGMDLRDHFAGKALGLCYAQYLNYAEGNGFQDDWRTGVAIDAYMMADAMIAARSR